jgi:hypothetical protein
MTGGSGVRMTIEGSTGNVSVGTTATGNRLTVQTATANDGIITTNGSRWLRMMPGTVGTGSYNSIVSANDNAIIYSSGTLGAGSLVIAPWASATSGIKMDANGNVGIGVVTPSKTLDVSGRVALYSGRNADPTMRGIGTSSWTRIGGNGGGLALWGNNNVETDDVPAMLINASHNVGIGSLAPAVSLAVGGNGANIYNTSAWIENNIHVQGNETMNQGGRGRLRVGSAWGYSGLYTDGTSTAANNDLVLGASSGLVRVGPGGASAQNLLIPNGYTQGIINNATSFAFQGFNTNVTGTGVYGTGNNLVGSYLTAGSGGAFTGLATGVFAYSTTSGVGQAIYTNQLGAITRVNYWSGVLQYKILGTGTVSTIAKDVNGNKVVLHAPEAPEIYFEDFGQGELVNGKAHIEIDPIVAKNVTINEKHPLRVFIQLEGECNGVKVVNKTANSFDVVELANGNSSLTFQWHIVCNRADEDLGNGRISRNADARFENAPADLEMNQVTMPKETSTGMIDYKSLKPASAPVNPTKPDGGN